MFRLNLYPSLLTAGLIGGFHVKGCKVPALSGMAAGNGICALGWRQTSAEGRNRGEHDGYIGKGDGLCPRRHGTLGEWQRAVAALRA
jgi:hypothetical protein